MIEYIKMTKRNFFVYVYVYQYCEYFLMSVFSEVSYYELMIKVIPFVFVSLLSGVW